MTRNGNREETNSSHAEQESKPPGLGRWIRLRDFVLSKSKGKKARYPEDRAIEETSENVSIRPPKFRDTTVLKQTMETKGNTTGFGDGSKSLRNLKKTRTFSSVFGTRKGKTRDVITEPQNELNEEQLDLERQPSKEPPAFSQKLERLRWVRESNANRTMIFNGDLPPSSPLSTRPLRSGEAEISKPRQSETEAGKQKDTKTNEQGNGTHVTLEVRDSEPSDASRSRGGSNALNFRKSLLIMRLGSIVIDDAHTASRLMSSPLASPRRMQRRSSSLPDHLGHSVERSSSAPGESAMGAKKGVSNDYESPWGVKDTSETDGETENRNSSKSFRVTDFVQGFKARKQAQSSSDNLSLTDDDESQEGGGAAEPVDMFEDDFVDYSVRHIQKAQGHKTFRARTRKGIQTFTQMH